MRRVLTIDKKPAICANGTCIVLPFVAEEGDSPLEPTAVPEVVEQPCMPAADASAPSGAADLGPMF